MFYALNGTEYPIASGSKEEEPTVVGVALRRTFSGAARSTVRARKRVFSLTTSEMSAVALEALITVLRSGVLTLTGGFVRGATLSVRAIESGGEPVPGDAGLWTYQYRLEQV